MYPQNIDSFPTLQNDVDNIDASHINNANTSIVNIESTLGTNPQGSMLTLKERLSVSINDDGTLKTSSQGITGLRGETGIQGIIGETGIIGPVGTQGQTGIQGVPGSTGIQGNIGQQGNTGLQGIQGIEGIQGIQGQTGVQGQTGIEAIKTWEENIIGAFGNGDPNNLLDRIQNNPINATPTNITVSLARCCFFKLKKNIVINKIRFFGIGSVSNVYRTAIYKLSDLSRLTSELVISATSQAWGSVGNNLNLQLNANEIYFIAVSVNATGTTAGILCHSATNGRIGVLPTSWPGNLLINSNIIDSIGFAQFAVTNGALPTTAPTLAARASWTGGMPAFFLDNNNS